MKERYRKIWGYQQKTDKNSKVEPLSPETFFKKNTHKISHGLKMNKASVLEAKPLEKLIIHSLVDKLVVSWTGKIP
jgi:hypothetical protein